MKQNKTNLKKRVHMYDSLEDATKQTNRDAKIVGKRFTDIVDNDFDIKNPYDQCVLETILTNLLAFLEIHAECDGVDMRKSMKEDFDNYLKMYRKQVKDNGFQIKDFS